ncbi:MAG: hypothetical protein RIB46_06445 [Pseudomonadales bacterium]
MHLRHVGTTLFALVLSLTAYAQPTPVTVRVLSHDAKFVGSSVGGALVTLTEADSGRVLAQGVTEGETGDTDLIVRTPRDRRASIVTEGAAGFTAQLDLERPTRIVATAYGPLDFPGSATSVSASRLLLPGQNLTEGDGWLLDLPGLIVELGGLPDAPVRLEDGKSEIPIRARVAMMCGCPIEPDGLWDAAEFEIEAMLERDGRIVRRLPMRYAGEPSEFAGTLLVTKPGNYHVIVTATQPRTGNSGSSRAAIGAL